MKLICLQENLNNGLSIVSRVVLKNSTLPILSNILFKAENNNLTLTAVNLEIAVIYQVRCKIFENGEITIPVDIFFNYVNTIPKDKIEIILNKNSLEIQSSKYKTTIIGQTSTDFPPIPKINTDRCYSIELKQFTRLLNQIIFVPPINHIRHEINGVFLRFEKDKIIAVATDGYRIIEKTVPTNNPNISSDKVIIPTKTLQELLRIISVIQKDISVSDQDDNFLQIYISDTQVVFKYNNFELISKVISGIYPNYETFIPKTHNTKLTINTEEFIKGVKISSLFSKNNLFDIVLEFNPESGLFLLKSSNIQIGENISEYKDVQIEGDINKIVLNHKYLLGGLTHMESENVDLEITNPNSPCLIRPSKEDKNEKTVYIILPLRE